MPLHSLLWCLTNQTDRQTDALDETLPLGAKCPAMEMSSDPPPGPAHRASDKGSLANHTDGPLPTEASAFLLESSRQVTLSRGPPGCWPERCTCSLETRPEPPRRDCRQPAEQLPHGRPVVQDAPATWAIRSLEQNVNLIVFEDYNIHLSVSCRCNLVCIVNLFFIKLPAPKRVSESTEPPG